MGLEERREEGDMWRQGDVLIQAVETIPEKTRRLKKPVIASSDSTGHKHQIRDRATATLYQGPVEMFLEVTADEARLVHPEHDAIVLTRGFYRIWRQQEHTDIGARWVRD